MLAGPEYLSVLASRKVSLFGLRVSLTTRTEQVVDRWLLASAAPHDSTVLAVLLVNDQELIAVGAGAVHDPFEMEGTQRHIEVWALPRKDSCQPWPDQVCRWISHVRRRVETALSVLVTVFNVEQLHARSLTDLSYE